ncbi:type II toxin-antitoxin system VapC family toxin [Rhizobium leguminosarum]|uniref:type II toxin-antitoxin system VapC family toxin n=1 Tax=Rhizobium leguminosarum TaxID=384 RepID=UPI001FE179F8|nr:PIN domain-containing protein [Rhizobium leguminosarum]
MLDTNIISTAYLPRPPEWLWEWLESLPEGAIAIPWTTVYETEYGIRTAQRYNPAKALELLAWFTAFLESRITFPDMNVEAARLLGEMAATPAMKHFFLTEGRRNKNNELLKIDRIKLGGDAMLAALAIAHRMPIVTLNIRDFLFIHQLFPLPGLYNPQIDEWFVDPPVGWGFSDNANDDEADAWVKTRPAPR